MTQSQSIELLNKASKKSRVPGKDFKDRRYRSDIFFQVKRQLSTLPTAEQIEENMNSLVEAIT